MCKVTIEIFFKIFIAGALCLTACKSTRVYKSTALTGASYHSRYDDTTLTVDNSSLLMPYNRFIDPAGTVIRFGNASLENHSLDCVLLPGEKVLAVEDRYGLAFIDLNTNKLLYHLDYEGTYKGLMSTYSGLKVFEDQNTVHIFWGASSPASKTSFILDAVWDGKKASIQNAISFSAVAPSPMALPNDIAFKKEDGEDFLYVVLNGNNQLTKIRLKDKSVVWTTSTGMAPFGIAITASKAYVTNWAGPVPVDTLRETAGIPYGSVYTDPQTGATAMGTVSIIELKTGNKQNEIQVGLHPNAILTSKDERFIYVSNGNSDYVSVISTSNDKVVDSISVRLRGKENAFIGDSPNALAIDNTGNTLYVSNGMDNAVAVVKLGEKSSAGGKGNSPVQGFIPTEAYPAGLALTENSLYVANLEGEGARVVS